MSEPSASPPSSPPPSLGLCHIALFVPAERFAATLRFYREAIGMRIHWQPDEDNVYLTSGADNFALHASHDVRREHSPLDHIGLLVADVPTVEAWYGHLSARADEWAIELLGKPRLHRDGASSFYLIDPAGNRVQIVYIPAG